MLGRNLCCCWILLLVQSINPTFAGGASASTKPNHQPTKQQQQQQQQQQQLPLNSLPYRIYPRRTFEEAAVIEWGSSAIISALDVSVAHFGPQTSQAALFEVETMPVLASPINGVRMVPKGEEDFSPDIEKLDNAEEVKGNVVIMTNAGNLLSGVQMAQIAQKSGAAALVVVNVDDEHPDDIYRLPANDEDVEIDIPVVMMSYNSASVLTSATVTPEMSPDEVVNHGMPERIRLYAGGDRPFFEDVVASEPPVYLIHNLLTPEECESLIHQASTRVQPVTEDDPLQLLQSAENYVNIQRVMLWQGLWQTAGRKAIEERIEQATGFPADHFTDFVVERLEPGSHWKPHFDTLDATPGGLPMATITIFLSDIPTSEQQDSLSASLVYPSAKGGPVRIRPQRGLAVIHHNWNEKSDFETNSLHALLEYTPATTADGHHPPIYIARKYVVSAPISTARRIALPALALAYNGGTGGGLPKVVSTLYDFLSSQFGHDTGGFYFDKFCVFLPVLVILSIIQLAGTALHKHLTQERKKDGSSDGTTPKEAAAIKVKDSSGGKDGKRRLQKQKQT